MKFIIELTEAENLQLAKTLYFAAANKDKMISDIGDYDIESAISINQKSLDAMAAAESRD